MEATVNDFLNEINEIVPPVPVTQVRSTAECVWQECFDDTTGFPYYWNMLTNAVTWEIPPEYQEYLDKTKTQKEKTKTSANTNKPLFPSVTRPLGETGESKTISASQVEGTGNQEVKKIKALPAYILDSDHDSQEGISKNGSNTNSPFHTNSKSNSQANSDTEPPDEVKPTLGFSLLANYGNSDEEDSQDEEAAAREESPKPVQTETHSVLFPATRPIDIKQFEQDTSQTNQRNRDKLPETSEEIDVKAFKRKRRIGVHLVNHPKKDSQEVTDNGIKDGNGKDKSKTDKEALMKTFGMSFVQGDTLQPTITENVSNSEGGACDGSETDETSAVIKEKLVFLSEGREVVSPVQVMSIQLEILYTAWKSGNLNSAYFTSWIKEISSDLIKLEEDATPKGWNLEWDRQEKRYFYRNKATEACQWEYPQQEQEHSMAAVNGDDQDQEASLGPVEERKVLEEGEVEDDDDDAMDICTTPPPLNSATTDGSNIEVTTICGDATDATEENATKNANLDLTSALDSFYSDIAAIETATKSEKETTEPTHIKDTDVPITHNLHTSSQPDTTLPVEPPKKRRKVKMSHGISMKKKGVSQLVEKWKNVQKDLD